MAIRSSRLLTVLNISTRWVHRMPSPNPVSDVRTDSTVEHTPLDLPNELWLMVMEHLGTAELYVLGRTSRRQNSLLCDFLWHSHFPCDSDDQGGMATNLDLTIHVVSRRWWRPLGKTVGVVSPSEKRHRSVDDLDLLSIILKPQPIRKLTCKFDTPNPSADKQLIPDQQLVHRYLSDDYQQLSRFISRLPPRPNLSHVNLILGPRDSQAYKEMKIDQDVWLTRTTVLNELFNLCIEKGCSSFHVSGGSVLSGISLQIYPCHIRWGYLAYIFGKKPSLAFIFSDRTTRIGIRWRIFTAEKLEGGLHPPSLMIANKTVKGKPKHKPRRSREIVQSQLTSLDIDDLLLVIPPFSNWTYQFKLIATSPLLTTLTLSNLDGLNPSYFEVMLTWLLEALKIQNALRCLIIKSDASSDPKGVLHLPPLLWFIHALGQAGETMVSSPTRLEELNLVGWRRRVLNPARLHKPFDGRATSRTLKRMKLHWAVLLALVGLNEREEYTKEMEATVLELVKERFTALEEIEVGVGRVLRIVNVMSGGKDLEVH